MPKRKSSDERCGDGAGAAKRPAVQPKQQHLYLVLDDWERGYRVRRLDVDAFDPAGAGTDDPPPPPERFTEPPVARIEAEHHVMSDTSFVSHGTKIFAMEPGEASPAIPAFDTRTLATSLCPWPFPDRCHGLPLFASAAGKLFVFTDTSAAYLGDQPPPARGGKAAPPWSWATMDGRPPFYASQVTCYALHPDGRTLFVSVASRRSGRSGTFSLDAERLEWARHGEWLLPFRGQAFFDAELDAWVGLDGGAAGRLCSCDVAPVAAELTSPPPWKLGEDRLFGEDHPERHLGARLVYMGNSKFCLVELLFHKDDDHLRIDHSKVDVDAYDYRPPPPRRRRVVCMNTFGLKYGKEGQLRTTMQRARACKVYKRPRGSGGGEAVNPLAFWL